MTGDSSAVVDTTNSGEEGDVAPQTTDTMTARIENICFTSTSYDSASSGGTNAQAASYMNIKLHNGETSYSNWNSSGTSVAGRGKTVSGGGSGDNYVNGVSYFYYTDTRFWVASHRRALGVNIFRDTSNYGFFGFATSTSNASSLTSLANSGPIWYIYNNGSQTSWTTSFSTASSNWVNDFKVSVYCVYRKIYKNTYDLKGGSGVSTSQTTYAGIGFNLYAAPTRSGYTFAGWKETSSSDTEKPVWAASAWFENSWADCAKTFEAVWQPDIPSSTEFDAYGNGGTVTLPKTQQINNISLTYYGYGFSVNSNGYFESNNKGIDISYSMMKIRFNAAVSSASFTIKYISYAESIFDYAIFSNLDSSLSESYEADSSYKKSTKGEASSSEKTLTYTGISSGYHNIYVKFRKDGSSSSYNDSLQLYFEPDWYSSSTPYKFLFKGLKYGTLPTASRTGYTFKGWYTSSSGGTQITSSSIFSGSSIYAQWTVNSYNITVIKGDVGINDITNPATSWNYNGGNVVGGGKQITVNFGTSQTISVSVKSGYSFSKWSGDSTSTSSSITCSVSSAKNYTYTANSKPNSYTVSFNAQGGTASSSSKSVTFNSAYGDLPTATRSYYTFDGWYTSSSGGTKITSTSTYTTVGNQTLYAHWTPVSITITVKLMMITQDGKTATQSSLGGSVTITRNVISGSSSSAQSVGQTADSGTYAVHQGQAFKIVASPKTSYIFAGFSTSSSIGDSIKNPISAPSTTATYYPTSATTYYVCFKQVNTNLLKYDSTDKYFYFEDGYYPQSEVTNSSTISSLNSSATANGETISYNEGANPRSLTVYTYGSDRYVKITKNGTTKWFKFEPIRWRISDYGIEKTEKNVSTYTTLYLFRNYSSYATNFMAVSDLILGVGSMNSTTTVKEGTSVTSMSAYTHTQNIMDECALNLGYTQTSKTIKVQSYSTYSQQNAVTESSISYSAPIRMTSCEELKTLGLQSWQARASDMVAFVLGVDKNAVSYWARDLSNLGSGVAISASGTQIRPWLDEMLGVRFAYNFSEGSTLI